MLSRNLSDTIGLQIEREKKKKKPFVTIKLHIDKEVRMIALEWFFRKLVSLKSFQSLPHDLRHPIRPHMLESHFRIQ